VFEVMGLAGRAALLDAALLPAEVDGLLVAPTLLGAPMTAAAKLAEYLGIAASVASTVDLGGASAAGMAWRATDLVRAGRARAVLCLLGEVIDRDDPYSAPVGWSGDPRAGTDRPYGYPGPNAGYALATMRHAHDYGTTAAQRARIVVDQRTNADGAPGGVTVDDVLASPLVCDPLHLLEIVRPTSGAAAFVVSTAPGPHPGVRVAGAGEHTDHAGIAQARSLSTSNITHTAARAFAESGLRPRDMDVLELYDCYPITVLLALEDARFCAKGTVGPFVAERGLTWAGDLPTNTNGGQLNTRQAGYAGGATHLIEAVRQLRGTARRQVPGCTRAFVHGNGGTLTHECSLVLARVDA
jgi:acetyl-CoA acetyltransferase